MLQGSGNLKHLADLIPIDVQALVLLHNGNDNANYTSKKFGQMIECKKTKLPQNH